MHPTESDPREEVYLLAALLSEIERLLHPLPRGMRGQVRSEMIFPPPLPSPTGPAGASGAMGSTQGSIGGGGLRGSKSEFAGVEQDGFTLSAVDDPLQAESDGSDLVDGSRELPRSPDAFFHGLRLDLPAAGSTSTKLDHEGAVTLPSASTRQVEVAATDTDLESDFPSDQRRAPKQRQHPQQEVEARQAESTAPMLLEIPVQESDTPVPMVLPRLVPPGRLDPAESVLENAVTDDVQRQADAVPSVDSKSLSSGALSAVDNTVTDGVQRPKSLGNGALRSSPAATSEKSLAGKAVGGSRTESAEDAGPSGLFRFPPVSTEEILVSPQLQPVEPSLAEPHRLALSPSRGKKVDAKQTPTVDFTVEHEDLGGMRPDGELGFWIASGASGPILPWAEPGQPLAPFRSAEYPQQGSEPLPQIARSSAGNNGSQRDSSVIDDPGSLEESLAEHEIVDGWEPIDPDWPSPLTFQVFGRAWELSRAEAVRIDRKLHSTFLDRALLRHR